MKLEERGRNLEAYKQAEKRFRDQGAHWQQGLGLGLSRSKAGAHQPHLVFSRGLYGPGKREMFTDESQAEP